MAASDREIAGLEDLAGGERMARWRRRLDGETEAALRWARAAIGDETWVSRGLDDAAHRAAVLEGIRLLAVLRDLELGSVEHRQAVERALRRRTRRIRLERRFRPAWLRARVHHRCGGAADDGGTRLLEGLAGAALYELHRRGSPFSSEQFLTMERHWIELLTVGRSTERRSTGRVRRPR